MAPKQRRGSRRSQRGGQSPQSQAAITARGGASAPVPTFASGPRRLLLITLGALVATIAIGAGLFTLVRGGVGGTTTTTCDPDPNGWNGAGGGMRNTGAAAVSIKPPGPDWKPSWSYPRNGAQASDRVVAPPSEANGTVYTATAPGILVALDAASGTRQWSSGLQQGEEGTVAVPIALDGCAAVLATNFQGTTGQPVGTLRAVDLRTHQRRWTVPTSDEIFSAPQVIDGVAYAGLSFPAPSGELDRIHVLDGYYLHDGSRAYRKTFGGALLASPTSDHQRIWIGSLDQNLYALGHNGKQLWTYTTNGIISLPAVYDGSSVIVASADHSVASLDPGSGREHWRVDVGDVQAPMAVSGDTLVVADVDGIVHALKSSDGTERWHADMDAKVSRAVVVAGDRIFVVDEDGILHVLDRATGVQTVSWTAPAPPAGAPAIAAGHLYLTCQDGRLYALPL
jgi:outer membrane protein assembly factor BamB